MSANTARFTSGHADLRSRRRALPRLPVPGGRRSAMVVLLVLLGMASFTTGAAADGTHHHEAPRMRFGDRVKLTTVCFTVTNPAGGQSTLYGLRYIDRGSRVDPRTPAIVLVHGIASSTENWDFSPTWSVARALAAAGYVVYSYDRLGYAKSSYFNQPNSAQPNGGNTLTTAAHRAELHQVVDEVESGSYTTTDGSDCSAPQRPAQARQPQGGHHRPQRGRLDRLRLPRHLPRRRRDDPGRHQRFERAAATRNADSTGSDDLDHPGSQPPRLLRVLPDPPGLRELQRVSAGGGLVRRSDRVCSTVSGFPVRRVPGLPRSSSPRTTLRST